MGSVLAQVYSRVILGGLLSKGTPGKIALPSSQQRMNAAKNFQLLDSSVEASMQENDGIIGAA